ncbi:hypothetical protein [Xanthomonas euvesicatoria]|uniref:hypothetical protein n=1 Tax=Xanthomonas euvesicatoria TaxID=456327 RepID=UPI001E53B5DE|nr:hypothetical protein [Xanthomonas euvesicatoria]
MGMAINTEVAAIIRLDITDTLQAEFSRSKLFMLISDKEEKVNANIPAAYGNDTSPGEGFIITIHPKNPSIVTNSLRELNFSRKIKPARRARIIGAAENKAED